MNLPKHVAIIMDGNGRWGLKKNKTRNFGHKEGLKTVEKIIQETIKHKIKYLTLFAFSTENWKRPKKEVNYLFKLLEVFIRERIIEFNKNNIKLKIIGIKNFSSKLNKLLTESEKKTKNNNKLQINLALNYGSKIEIVHTVKKLIKNNKKINEHNISKNLFTENIQDPDLLIRTGNTNRLSIFFYGKLLIQKFFLKRNYGQILMRMIILKF